MLLHQRPIFKTVSRPASSICAAKSGRSSGLMGRLLAIHFLPPPSLSPALFSDVHTKRAINVFLKAHGPFYAGTYLNNARFGYQSQARGEFPPWYFNVNYFLWSMHLVLVVHHFSDTCHNYIEEGNIVVLKCISQWTCFLRRFYCSYTANFTMGLTSKLL